jgi:FixJ family two-component response regulator
MLSIQGSRGHVASWAEASSAASLLAREPLRAAEAACAPVVHIIDPDGDAERLAGWLKAAGLGVRDHATLADFMEDYANDTPGCLVVDARIAGGTEVDLATFVRRLGVDCPIVMTACGADVSTAVLAMKTGAVDFVEKPLREPAILAAIACALQIGGERRQIAERRAKLNAYFATLTQRERQVMALVTTGKLNKQVAGDLGVSEITVKAHRGSVMRKMGARSIADLVRMADALGAAVSAAMGGSEQSAHRPFETAPARVAV